MSDLRRWLASALVASSFVALPEVAAAPAQLPLSTQEADASLPQVSYGQMPTVAAGQETRLEVSGDEAFSFHAPSHPMYRVEESGAIVVTPPADFEGFINVGVHVEHPDLGEDLTHHTIHVVRPSVIDRTNPALPAFSGGHEAEVFADTPGRVSLLAADRRTGSLMHSPHQGYSFSLGAPDASRGWSIPPHTSVSAEGEVDIAANSAGLDGTYVIPVVVTETATGRLTTVEVKASLSSQNASTDEVALASANPFDAVSLLALFLTGVAAAGAMFFF